MEIGDKRMKLKIFLLACALLALPTIAEAQKTCTPLTATTQNCIVTLNWTITVDATHPAPTSVQLRRSDGTGAMAVIGTVMPPVNTLQNTFTDSGDVAHCWDAIAVLGADSSVPSNKDCWTTPAIVVPPPLVPPTPSGFSVSAISSGTIELSWAAVDIAEAYKWERRKGNQPKIVEANGTLASITNYRDSSLRRGTTYCYDVAAINVSGISGATPVLCATTRR